MRARRLPMECNIIEWNVEARQSRNIGDTSQTHIHGCRKIRQQTRRWYHVEQEVEAKKNWHWIHQRTCHLHHNRGQPPTHQTDECVFHHPGYADHHIEKMYKTIEKHTGNIGLCCTTTQHSTRCTEKTPQKHTTFVSPKGSEKQIDYIQTKRRYLRHNKDAEANDMIHMGSGHRCVMATFLINMLGKDDADSVVPANEAGGWPDDGLNEKKKTSGIKIKIKRHWKAHPQKPRRLSLWRLHERQVKNIPIEAQQTWRQIASRVKVTTRGTSTRSLRQVLSCYMSATTWTKVTKMVTTVKTVKK